MVGAGRLGRESDEQLDQSRDELVVFGEVDHSAEHADAAPSADAADTLAGTPEARALPEVQPAAQVLLPNGPGAAHLPLSGYPKVYLEGMAAQAVVGWAQVVASPEEADVEIVRTSAPWEERGKPGEFESFFRAGSLEFHADELAHLAELAATVPLVVDVFLDRPGILALMVQLAGAVIRNFGSTDEALAQVVFGGADPTFPVGFGLR